MRQIRTDSTWRYECAHLICAYLLANKKIRAAVTSREIALFHHLSRKSSQSISAMLNFLNTNQIRESRFGFYIMGTAPFRKCDYPHHYTIPKGTRRSSRPALVSDRFHAKNNHNLKDP